MFLKRHSKTIVFLDFAYMIRNFRLYTSIIQCLLVDKFRTFFRFYDKDVSPELFENFEKMIKNGDIISVKEVYHELEKQHQNDSEVMQMIKRIKKIFQEPTKKLHNHKNNYLIRIAKFFYKFYENVVFYTKFLYNITILFKGNL